MATSRCNIYSRCTFTFTIFSSNSFWSFSALDFSKRRFRSSCRIRACSSLVWVYGEIKRTREEKKKRKEKIANKIKYKDENVNFMKRFPFTKPRERKRRWRKAGGHREQMSSSLHKYSHPWIWCSMLLHYKTWKSWILMQNTVVYNNCSFFSFFKTILSIDIFSLCKCSFQEVKCILCMCFSFILWQSCYISRVLVCVSIVYCLFSEYVTMHMRDLGFFILLVQWNTSRSPLVMDSSSTLNWRSSTFLF